MATITYSKASASYAPWQTTYDASGTVAEALPGGYVGYFAQDIDGTDLIVKARGGLLVSIDWVDWLRPDPELMHADLAMDPAAFLDALNGFRPSTRKAINALQSGDDDITGSVKRDKLWGGGGDDVIRGGVGNDKINGGEGQDTLEGGAGADRLVGGAGADIFRFGAGDGLADSITDFTPGEDLIDLRPIGVPLVFGGNVIFDAAAGQLLVDLDGVPGAELGILLSGVPALLDADLILG